MSIRFSGPQLWQIRAYAGIDANGRARYVYKTVAGSKAEARREELKLKGAAGVLPRGAEREAITLEQYAERWLTLYVAPRVVPKSLYVYRTALKGMILPSLGGRKLKDITADDIQRTFNELKHAPATLIKTRTILSGLFSRARKSGLILSNPCEDVVLPRRNSMPRRPLTPDEARRLLDACLTCDDGLLITAALLTGLRKSELLSLRWENVDLAGGVIKVREGGSVPGTTKSESSRRDVLLPSHLLDLFREERRQDDKRRAFTPTWNPTLLVFPSIAGRRRSSNDIPGRNLRRALILAGIDIKGYRFHDLRHAHGSLLVMAGIPLPAIQERLGHASLATTVQTYLHNDGAASERISAYLNDVAGSGIVH